MKSRSETATHGSALPTRMEAAALERFGPPNVLEAMTLPVPTPGPGQVLIAVHAAGVGVWDQLMRNGSWQPQAQSRPPVVIGTDAAGIVVDVGQRVTGVSIGERVFAWGYGGFYAEYVAVDAGAVGVIPKQMDFLEAAAASASGLTTLQGLYDILHVKAGDTLLIMGGSGSMGTLAIQFAKHQGARVTATASGKEAQQLVYELGADVVLDSRHKDGLIQLRNFAPDGVDAALVLGAGPTLEQYLDFVRPGGRIAYPYGASPEPRQRSGIRVVGYNLEAGPKEMVRMTRLSTETNLRVPIAAVYPLAQAAEAHERLEAGHVLGKIVLRTRLDVR